MVPPEMLRKLAEWIEESRSLDNDKRRAANDRITSSFAHPDFVVALLALAVSGPPHTLQVRIDASVHFKNIIVQRWPKSSPDTDTDAADHLLPIDRAVIKDRLLNDFISAPPRIQTELSAALATAAACDPATWDPPVLPSVLSRLNTAVTNGDVAATNSLLVAVSSIFSRFSKDNICLYGFSLNDFAVVHLDLLNGGTGYIRSRTSSTTASELCPMFERVGHCYDVLYCLKSHFPDCDLSQWTTHFCSFLSATYPLDVEASGAPNAARVSILRNIQLLVEKYEQESYGLLKEILDATWKLFSMQMASPLGGQCIMASLKVFAAVAGSRACAALEAHDTIKSMCAFAILPNLHLQVENEQLFQSDWVKYIRLDSGGSEFDTRRQISGKLLRSLAMNCFDQVSTAMSAQVQQTLIAYTTDPVNNWKAVEALIYIAIKFNQIPLVDPVVLLYSVIMPELQHPDWQTQPILKATMLKFLKKFWDQIPKNTALVLLPSVLRLLTHQSNVVHSYASIFTESLIEGAVLVPGPNTVNRMHLHDIDPFIPQIIQALFTAINYSRSHDNPYLWKCVLRVLGVASIPDQIAQIITTHLASILMGVCNNPENPDLNYYFFETLATMIGRTCQQHPALLRVCEASILPGLQKVLVDCILELLPFSLQISALLVKVKPLPLSNYYSELLDFILMDASWDLVPSIPALACILQAFLQKCPEELHQSGKLGQLCLIFQRRVGEIDNYSGFAIINTMATTLGVNYLSHSIVGICTLLFRRLDRNKDVNHMCSVIVFMSLVLERHGLDFLVTNLDSVHDAAFDHLLNVIWIPSLKYIKGAFEVKLALFASTTILCQYKAPSVVSAPEIWGSLLESTVALLNRDKDETQGQDDGEDSSGLFDLGYMGRIPDVVVVPPDPKHHLVTSLSKLSTESPGRLNPIIQKHVKSASQSILQRLCVDYNASIV